MNEDSRTTHFMTPPYVRKCIDKVEDREVEISYNINVNELESVVCLLRNSYRCIDNWGVF